MAPAHATQAAQVRSDERLLNYRTVRSVSEALAAPLAPEDTVVQTIPEVSPTKWHLAHVTWFFERFCLSEFDEGYVPFDDRYDYLFNSYYYTVGEMHARARRGLLSRPLLCDVLEYRAYVDHAMFSLLERRGGDPEFEFRVQLGLHHEQQHQELLLTDIKHVFGTNPLGPVYRKPAPAAPAPQARTQIQAGQGSAPDHRFVDFDGGLHSIGADPADGFCFDNETPRHQVLVGDHSLGNRLVTNAEFRDFIDAGGYSEPAHWLADGWARVVSGELARPLYWSEDFATEFTLGGWRPIDPAAPVCHVSYYEADAFARWAGARLPLEAELELATTDTAISGNLLEAATLHPVALNDGAGVTDIAQVAGTAGLGDSADVAAIVGSNASNVRQLWGDVWEWTGSPYGPYPRFQPLAGSLGEYNGKFMANQIVVRGGSCVTSTSHLRSSYRSFFYPHDRWQFLGFRLARDR